MAIDLFECYADDDFVVRQKEPPAVVPEVSLGSYLFDKLDEWGDLELFVSKGTISHFNTPMVTISISGTFCIGGQHFRAPLDRKANQNNHHQHCQLLARSGREGRRPSLWLLAKQ